MRPFLVLGCLAGISMLFVPAYAHTLDSVGDYRLELQWEVEPPYSGQVNAIKLYVSPLVPGLELEEQPFQNGVKGLENTLKIQLDGRDHTTTLLLDADEFIPGLYRAHVMVLRPGFYQANILGEIEETAISLSLHPHQVRDVNHIIFPNDYGELYDMRMTQDELRADVDMLVLGLGDINGTVSDLESAADSHASSISDIREMLSMDQNLVLVVMPGVAGMILGGAALYMARRPAH